MNRTNSARRRAGQIRRERTRSQGGRHAAASEESRTAARLVVCGALFVFLVAVKLLFPETVSRLAQSVGQLIGRDADFKEAFAAMGRAISGEAAVSDSLQDAYTAVFNPSAQAPEEEPAGEDAASSETTAGLDPGARLMRYTAHKLPVVDTSAVVTETLIDSPPTPPEEEPAPPDAGPSEPTAGPEEAATAALSYVYTMPAMPDNASLEQRNLGFDHCTPVFGALSSPFGWREHPIEGGSKFHYGIDLAAEEGEAILAFADGSVYATGESSSLGNYIMLQHESGYITLYAHCSRVTASGGAVAKGEKIAEVGSTGLATGPHLHFELHDGDLYLNPIFYVEIR